MKHKNRFLVLFLILSFCAGSLAIFGNPKDDDEILEGMHPFYDAKVLDDALKKIDSKESTDDSKKNASKEIIQILKKYAKGPIEAPSDAEEMFKENQFLLPYIKTWSEWFGNQNKDYKNEITVFTQSWQPSEEKASPFATGILSPTMLVDALGSFIAERFKEELSIAFLNKIKKNEALKKLFPKTAEFLTSAGVYNFKLFLPTLKVAINQDLNALDEGLFGYINNKWEKVENKVKANKTLNLLLFLWEQLVKVKAGKHPAEIIDDLNQSPYIGPIDSDFSSPVRLMALISRNLRNEKGDGWLNGEIPEILKKENINQLKLYIGLIYAREIEELGLIKFNEESLKETIDKNAEKIDKIVEKIGKSVDYINEISSKVKEIQDIIDKLEKDKDNIKYEEYHDYLKKAIDLIKVGVNSSELFTNKKIEIGKYLEYANKILGISNTIHDKRYEEALLEALELLKDLIPDESPLKDSIVKFFSFAINISRAESTQEMLSVIESAALPVGSYRCKRANYFNISLNAYFGPFLNNEKLESNTEGVSTKKNKWNPGLTAPIGLAFNWRLRKGNSSKIGYSWSIFAPIIDIGAVVNWRLKDEDGELPEIKWKNIIAPGIFGVLGMKKNFISIGVGVQYGPQLRGIKKVKEVTPSPMAADNTIDGNSNQLETVIYPSKFRFKFFIAMDIPIFNLYTKHRKDGGL